MNILFCPCCSHQTLFEQNNGFIKCHNCGEEFSVAFSEGNQLYTNDQYEELENMISRFIGGDIDVTDLEWEFSQRNM